jgi:hypothetical protein
LAPEYLEDCTARNIDISSRAIFNETIGISESIKRSLDADGDEQKKTILGFERMILIVDRVWIRACMEEMKWLTIQWIMKTIEGLKLF